MLKIIHHLYKLLTLQQHVRRFGIDTNFFETQHSSSELVRKIPGLMPQIYNSVFFLQHDIHCLCVSIEQKSVVKKLL